MSTETPSPPRPREMTAANVERLRGMAKAAMTVLKAVDDELADQTSVRGWSANAGEGCHPGEVVARITAELGLTMGHLDLVERELDALARCFRDI